MTGPISLKSYNDSGNRDSSAGYWQIDFTMPDEYGAGVDSQLTTMSMPFAPPQNALAFDFMGPLKKIKMSGSRIDGDLNNGSAMTNAAWVTLLEGLQQGKQVVIGPFRLVCSGASNNIPAGTTKVYVDKFDWKYSRKVINAITYDLDLVVGGGLQ